MPTVTVNTDVDVDVELEEFDTDDLIEEIESRGYAVCDKDEKKALHTFSDDMEDVIWEFKRGQPLEALIRLERAFPELYGISKLVS